jgi:hypothetical protein
MAALQGPLVVDKGLLDSFVISDFSPDIFMAENGLLVDQPLGKLLVHLGDEAFASDWGLGYFLRAGLSKRIILGGRSPYQRLFLRLEMFCRRFSRP